MKQLKVVVNDTPSNLLTQAGGYVTANFVNPVEVKKGSLICLDKFNATSKNISQNFGVVSQTFTIGVNVVDEANPVPFTSVTIPSGTYNTLQDYIAAVNQLVNATAISAFRVLPVNTWSGRSYFNVQSQNGMRVYLQIVDGLIARWTSQCYGYTSLSTTPSADWTPSLNSAINISGRYYSTDTLAASIISAGPCVLGGGISTTSQIQPSSNSTTNWVYGFISDDTTALGGKILQKTGSPNIWVQNDAGQQFEIANSQTKFAEAYAGSGNAYFMLYQQGGLFKMAYHPDATNPTATWYTTDQDNLNMGSWYYSSSYNVSQTFQGTFAGFGDTIYTPQSPNPLNAVFPYPDDANTFVNLSSAPQFSLIFGFQIADGLKFVDGEGGAFQGLITGTKPANILQLRSAFELAIEIIDLPLKTYFAQSGTTNKTGYGGRQNVVCYFTPTPSIEAEGLYSFSNSVHQWLDIDNSADTTLHSLSFRVFNSYTGDSFISNSMGFNLLIKSPDERMEN